MTGSGRLAELAENLSVVQGQIAKAARAVGRDPADITLVVVTKTFPAGDIRLLHDLGVRDVGENRHPEAAEKAAEVADLDLTWHFVGQVQSNKATAVTSYADVVHSVDSTRLAERLGAGARRHGRAVMALVQVSLDMAPGTSGRGGVAPERVDAVAHAVDKTDALVLRGLMAVAPQHASSADAFLRLAKMGHQLRLSYPAADLLSAGMSGDFPLAIRAGATHVRVGTAVLGSRPPLR